MKCKTCRKAKVEKDVPYCDECIEKAVKGENR